MRINHNISSMIGQSALGMQQSSMSKSLEKLSMLYPRVAEISTITETQPSHGNTSSLVLQWGWQISLT